MNKLGSCVYAGSLIHDQANPWQRLCDADKASGKAVDVELMMKDGSIRVGHYAYGDGDGLMPPFDGWFVRVESQQPYYREVFPVAWRPKYVWPQPPEPQRDRASWFSRIMVRAREFFQRLN